MRPSDISPTDHETSSMEDEFAHQEYDESADFEGSYPMETNSSTEEEDEDIDDNAEEDENEDDECDEDFDALRDYPAEDDFEEEEEEEEEIERDDDEFDDSQDTFWQELDLDRSFTSLHNRPPPSDTTHQFSESYSPSHDFDSYGIKSSAFQTINNSLSQTIQTSFEACLRTNSYNSLSYLMPGRSFVGTQIQVLDSKNSENQDRDRWEVKVTIHSIDLSAGTIVGLMEALNVPVASSTVITYWEGEIVDFINYDLWTKKWGASERVDIDHWRRFDAFKGLNSTALDEHSHLKVHEQYIFMRWKEKFFVNILPHESGLTIAGFYYICIRRSDGFVEGFYYDPTSKPFQRLALNPMLDGNGHSFSEYTFA